MNHVDIYLDSLVRLTHQAGGWGYGPDQVPQVEPTCLALLALSLDREKYSAPIHQGLACLRQWQDSDGAVRVREGPEQAVWPTALALFTLAVLEDDTAAQSRAASWLVETRGQPIDDPKVYKRDFDIDPELVGWPWGEGNFAWVEPTAWACLALRRAGWESHPRVEQGLQLLLDRALDEGGINYGNRRVFGRLTEPVPTTTALMLLALAGKTDHARMQSARSYLLKIVEHDQDLENLCWARLALDPWKQNSDVATALSAMKAKIESAYRLRRETALFPDAPMREALTALALSTDGCNPFDLSQRQAVAGVSDPGHKLSPVHRRRPSLGEKLVTTLRGWGVKAVGNLRAIPQQSQVHIAPASDYQAELARVLQDQYETFRAQAPLKDKRVVLKPNMVEYHRDKVINTHPHVVAAVIELCRREGAAEVTVAEGPGHWRNAEYLVTASGLGDVLRHYHVPFVDLNHDDPVKTPNLGRCTKLEYLYLSRTIATADVVISLPKLKTHHWVGVTLSLKNLFGTMPGVCYGWPKNQLHWRGIDNSIVDIALTRTPDLAIVDGIIGMEGDGPLNGSAKPLGVLVMGADLLAVDATCCRLMGLNPEKVGYLWLGAQKRLGLLHEHRIAQLGERIDVRRQPFETLPLYAHLHDRPRTGSQSA